MKNILAGLFSSAKKEAELSAVFDLGSSSVGCAFFYRNRVGIPKIIYSLRKDITLEADPNPERFMSLALKSLNALANKAATSGLGAPKEIHVVLSSPWYASQTRVVKLSRKTPFKFNKKLADELLAKELKLFGAEHKLEEGDLRQIEVAIMKTLANGYPALPLGQKVNELEMNVFISMSPDKVLKKIEEIIFRHFHSQKVRFSSFILNVFTVARDLFTQHEDFLLVDIGGEVTDISLVKKETLHQSATFPMGRNYIVRGIALKMRSTLTEAVSLLSLYKDGHADSSAKTKLDPVVGELSSGWLQKFQESLPNLSSDAAIPATIFMTVDPDLAAFFTNIIEREQFTQYVLTDSKFNVIILNMETLHGIALFEEKVVRDPFLIVEAVYINRFL